MGRIIWPMRPNNPIRPKVPAKPLLLPRRRSPPPPPHFRTPSPVFTPSWSVPADGVARSPSSRGASKGPPAAALRRAAPEWLSSSTNSRRYASLSASLHMSGPSRDLDLSDPSRSPAIKRFTDFRGTRKVLTRIARFRPIEYGHGSSRHDAGLASVFPILLTAAPSFKGSRFLVQMTT